MENSKQVLAILSFFLIASFCNVFAKPACAVPTFLSELNESMDELLRVSGYTKKSMDWVRNNKGYASHRGKNNCVLPTHLLYNRLSFQFYNAATLKEHLQKMADTLFPLFNATFKTNFSKQAKNKTLKSDLAVLQSSISQSAVNLMLMNYQGTSKISYDPSKLTVEIKAYMKCAGFKVTSNGVRFMGIVTFVESVRQALFGLTDDVRFIKECLCTRN